MRKNNRRIQNIAFQSQIAVKDGRSDEVTKNKKVKDEEKKNNNKNQHNNLTRKPHRRLQKAEKGHRTSENTEYK